MVVADRFVVGGYARKLMVFLLADQQ